MDTRVGVSEAFRLLMIKRVKIKGDQGRSGLQGPSSILCPALQKNSGFVTPAR